MRFLPFKKLLFATSFLLAGSTLVRAQRFEVMTTGGGLVQSNKPSNYGGFDGPSIGYIFNIKAGLLFPSRTGVALFYEQARLKYKRSAFSKIFNARLADPQTSVGLELYRKSFVGNTAAYLRYSFFGACSFSQTNDFFPGNGAEARTGSGFATGIDVAYIFPLARRLSGVLNGGVHFYQSFYNFGSYRPQVQTIGIPLTIGLHYKFAGRGRQATPFSKEAE